MSNYLDTLLEHHPRPWRVDEKRIDTDAWWLDSRIADANDNTVAYSSSRSCPVDTAEFIVECVNAWDKSSADDPLAKVDYEIRNLARHGLEWEWMTERADGQYLDRDAVIAILNKYGLVLHAE